MRSIPLTQGKYAIVDDEDFERVNQYKWCLYNGKYGARGTYVNGKKGLLRLHQFILSTKSGEEVDHINGDGLDNQKANLRICTRKENSRNSRKLTKSYSIYRGVSKYRDRWRTIITVDYKPMHIGIFNTEKEAARAYNDAASLHFGKYARMNKIEE